MAFAIRVNVRSCGGEVIDFTVRESDDFYGLTRDLITMSICRITHCNPEENKEYLMTGVYNARLHGTANLVFETDVEYQVSLVHGTEDFLTGYNMVE